jgi:molybdopterin-guanine dinucleotide biosynthesis protein A
LRLAPDDPVVVVPTDMPWMTVDAVRALAAAVEGVDAAVPSTGPLPGAYRREAASVLEGRIAAGELALHQALGELRVRTVELDAAVLGNVNAPDDLGRRVKGGASPSGG